MKLKDIKVGEEYAVGSENCLRRARVMEVGDITHTTYRRGWGRQEVTTKNRVRITYLDSGFKSEVVVVPGQVRRLWAEQEVINAEKHRLRQEGLVREAQRAAADEALYAEAKAVGISVAVGRNEVTMSADELRRVVDRLRVS